MTTVISKSTAQSFPQPEVPAGTGGTNSGTLGTGMNMPNTLAGAYGAFSINGVALGAGGQGLNTPGALLDLTQWGLQQLMAQINQTMGGPLAPVTATTSAGRLLLTSPPGVPIVIAGSAAILTCLGLVAGTTVE